MATSGQGITRRSLLTGVFGAAAAAAVGSRRAQAGADRAKVIRVESSNIWRGDARNADVVSQMVTRGVVALTGDAKPEAAWARFFKPGTRVVSHSFDMGEWQPDKTEQINGRVIRLWTVTEKAKAAYAQK